MENSFRQYNNKAQSSRKMDISSKEDSDETCTMHTKSDNKEIMMGSETD